MVNCKPAQSRLRTCVLTTATDICLRIRPRRKCNPASPPPTLCKRKYLYLISIQSTPCILNIPLFNNKLAILNLKKMHLPYVPFSLSIKIFHILFTPCVLAISPFSLFCIQWQCTLPMVQFPTYFVAMPLCSCPLSCLTSL